MRSGWPTTVSVSSNLVMQASLTTTAVVAAPSALVSARPRSRRTPEMSKKSPATLTALEDWPASGRSPERHTRTLPLENGPLVVYAIPRTRPSARMRASNASMKARRSAGPYLLSTSKRSSAMSVCGACGGSSPMVMTRPRTKTLAESSSRKQSVTCATTRPRRRRELPEAIDRPPLRRCAEASERVEMSPGSRPVAPMTSMASAAVNSMTRVSACPLGMYVRIYIATARGRQERFTARLVGWG
jgi:hypothetical protein